MTRVSQLWDFIEICGFREDIKDIQGIDDEEEDDKVEDNGKDNDNN